MRNRFNGSRRGRRPDSFGSVPGGSSPYDFTPRDEDSPDPVDLLSIRADDELLDALASGLSSFTGSDGRHALGVDHGLDDNINDDQQMLALLAAWRDEVRDEPIPELISVEDASEAIVAGHRTERPRRRLMSVAAAAAAVVVGMSGVALGAGNAKPGDTLWGVSKALDSDRASSVEAAQQVSVTLASVRQALAEGHVAEAQAKLATITPVLSKVTDEQAKNELAGTQANLVQTVETAKEGEKVETDDSGKRDDDHGSDHHSDHQSDRSDNRSDHQGGPNGHDPRSDGSKQDQPNPADPRSDVLRSMDPRFSSGKPGGSNPGGSNPGGSSGPETAGAGPGHHGPGTTTSQPDPRRGTTTEPKPSTKPSSGPRPSKWNPPPRKTTTAPSGGGHNGSQNGGAGNGGGNSGAGGGGAGGNGGGSQQGKSQGEHKAEGEGAPVGNGQPAQNAPAQNAPAQNAPAQNSPAQNAPARHNSLGQPGPRPVPPGS